MTDCDPGHEEGRDPAQVDHWERAAAEAQCLELELLQVRLEGMLVTSVMVVLGAAAVTVASVLVLTGRWSLGDATPLAGAGVVAGPFGLLFGVPQGLMAFRGLQKCKALLRRLTVAMDRHQPGPGSEPAPGPETVPRAGEPAA